MHITYQASSPTRYTVVYYVHQSWERCRNRGLLESLGLSFPGSGFNSLVKARDQYPSTHDRIQEAMKDLILDQDQHEGKSDCAVASADSTSFHLAHIHVFGTTKSGTMQEPIEVIDYSSDEDFVLDGDEPDEGSEGASFASSNNRGRSGRALKVAVI